MDYQQSLDYLHHLIRFGWKPGLQRMDYLMKALGNPEQSLAAVHVGGTNGKGSTCAMTTTVLREAGYRVAAFTKPHLQHWNERMTIDGRHIPEEKVAELVTLLSGIVEGMEAHGVDHATEFEVTTAAMFKYFADEHVDLSIVEVGLGGTLDSTNVLPTPLASVITNVAYDHMDILGSTISEIAGHKAGIIKPGGLVITESQNPEVLRVIDRKVRENGARLWRVIPDGAEAGGVSDGGPPAADVPEVRAEAVVTYRGLAVNREGCRLDVTTPDATHHDLKVSLLGAHQMMNAATAVAVITALRRLGWEIDDESLRRGLETARWPGRLEVVQDDPLTIIDGAHNHDGAAVLRDAIERIFPDHRLTLVIGILADKEISTVLNELVPLAERVIVTRPDSSRAADPAVVAEEARRVAGVEAGAGRPAPADITVIEKPESAVRRALEEAGRGSADPLAPGGPRDPRPPLVLITGSLYLIGKIRGLWFDEVTW
ncbi:MAG TPA: folylpolyglutamate synthase/dihydrofolate synthase family protein [Bacillota bacterium]